MDRFELATFNLNLLVALDALLGERSVSAAAKRTRVTPSAMSHSLAELRALLDDPLLVRSGRAMVLTPRAEELGPPLRKLLQDAKRLLAGGATFEPATAERRFVIAAPDFLATLLLPPLLEAIALEAPGVHAARQRLVAGDGGARPGARSHRRSFCGNPAHGPMHRRLRVCRA